MEAGVLSILIGLGLYFFQLPFLKRLIPLFLFIQGGILLVESLWMIFSSLWGKEKVFDALIASCQLNQGSHLLDVGCGSGRFLIKVSSYLKEGKALGLDLLRKGDQTRNSAKNFLKNIENQELNRKIQLLEGDMRKIPMESTSVDIVTASLAIHNIVSAEGRSRALEEISRVLKPGGQVALMDFRYTKEYKKFFEGTLQWPNVMVTKRYWWMFPPTKIVKAQKPN